MSGIRYEECPDCKGSIREVGHRICYDTPSPAYPATFRISYEVTVRDDTEWADLMEALPSDFTAEELA